jgi:dTDP-4-dehydrorhamnose reductase
VRLLVTGVSGQVGWELARSLAPLGDVVAVDRHQFDLSRPESLTRLVREINPTVIVNAAAYTAVDKAEDEERLATTVNGTAVAVLAEEARAGGAILIHYSTDYVFDGRQERPYLEDDQTNPISAYGRSKLAGETAIRQTGGAYLIFRTSWVYAARGHNFVRTMLRLAAEKDEVRVVVDQIGAPNWARHIADTTTQIVSQVVSERAAGSFVSGLFHLTASGSTSWYNFAKVIFEQARTEGLLRVGSLPRLHPIPAKDFPTRAARPANSRLNAERLTERFGLQPTDWEQGLMLCLQEISRQRL